MAASGRRTTGWLLVIYWALALSCLHLFASLAQAVEEAQLSQVQWLHGRDFAINFKFKIVERDNVKLTEVTEFYSNAKQTARLLIKQLDGPMSPRRTTEYFYTNGQLLRRVYLADGKTPIDCIKSNTEQLFEDLNIPKGAVSTSWLVGQNRLPSYLIGLMRFAWLVEANRDKIADFSASFVRPNSALGHFNFRVGDNQNEEKEIHLYQSRGSIEGDNPPNGELPSTIWIERDLGDLIVVPSSFRYLHHDEIGAVDQPINYLLLPLGADCNEPLARMAPPGTPTPRVVSFRALLEKVGEPDGLMDAIFVAYDGYLGMLRHDHLTSGGSQWQYSSRVHNLKQRVELMASHNRFDRNYIENQQQFVSLLTGEHSTNCFAAQSTMRADELEPVIPLSQLSLMGDTHVRGIECVVAEMQANQLPPLFFPKVEYRNQDQWTEAKYNPNRVEPGPYSLAYYFALGAQDGGQMGDLNLRIGNRQLGQLVQLEVRKFGRLEYRIHVESFQWQLSDAPNGDRPDELFSLAAKCPQLSAEMPPDQVRLAKLRMDLRYTIGLTAANRITIDELKKLIGEPSIRNRALIRSLVDNTDLRAAQIDHIESRILGSTDSTLMINLVAKLNGSPTRVHNLYELVSVGYGAPMNHIAFPRAEDFESCFWMAVARRELLLRDGKGENLIFSHCDNQCTMDEEPTMTQSSFGTRLVSGSRVFLFLQNYVCQVFRLEKVQMTHLNHESWEPIRAQLKAKPLSLQVINNQKAHELSLMTRGIDLDVFSVDGQNSHKELHGLSLPNSGPSIVLVENKESPISLTECKAHCFKSKDCLSYSYCSYLDQSECLTSSWSFKDQGTLEEIAKAKSTSKRRLKSIKVDLADAELELRVDPRCRIYNKQYLEMFKPVDYKPVAVESRFLSLVPVNDLEQCAESCMDINSKFFADSTISLDEFDASLDENVNYLSLLKKAQVDRLRTSWCSSFYYVDLSTGQKLPENMVKTIGAKRLDGKGGLCVRPRGSKGKVLPSSKGKDPSKIDPLLTLSVKNYEFSFISLYDPMAGYKMKYFAYHTDIYDKDKRLKAEEVTKILNRGNKQLMQSSKSAEECARDCFLQNIGSLQPWCRSFDYVTYNALAKNQMSANVGSSHSYCILNTNTLRVAKESINSEWLVSEVGADTLVRHYEPHDSFTNQHIVVTRPSLEDLDPSLGLYTQTLPRAGLLVLLFFSLFSGLALGIAFSVCFGRHIERSLDKERNQIPGIPHARFESEVE